MNVRIFPFSVLFDFSWECIEPMIIKEVDNDLNTGAGMMGIVEKLLLEPSNRTLCYERRVN